MAAFEKVWSSSVLYLSILLHHGKGVRMLGCFDFSALLHVTEVEGKDQIFCGGKSMDLHESCYQFMLPGN